jgi:hypothetical protein
LKAAPLGAGAESEPRARVQLGGETAGGQQCRRREGLDTESVDELGAGGGVDAHLLAVVGEVVLVRERDEEALLLQAAAGADEVIEQLVGAGEPGLVHQPIGGAEGEDRNDRNGLREGLGALPVASTLLEHLDPVVGLLGDKGTDAVVRGVEKHDSPLGGPHVREGWGWKDHRRINELIYFCR